MTAAHTPGPWTVDAKSLPTRNGTRYTAYELRGGPDISDSLAASREVEANARLIAAAPELLAALQSMLAAEAKIDDEYYEAIAAAEEQAREAIAKATS